MDDKFYEKLLSAIKKDDIKAFNECKQVATCGNIRFGRFPVLSVMYLYKAKKLISAYEDTFIKYNSWQDAPEPASLSADFMKVAKKCLRLYISEYVTPLEMLLILDDTKRVKKLYSAASPSPAVKENLKEIYSIKYSLNLTCETNEIYMEKRPMTRSEKKRLLIAAISSVLCVAIIVSTPFIVNIFKPFIGVNNLTQQEGENPPPDTEDPDTDVPLQTAEVSSWEEIDFASSNEYILTKDLLLSGGESVEEMNCSLNGNGKTITFDGDAPLIRNFSGSTVTDLTVNTTGKAPIFGKIEIESVVENLTVNANLNMTTDHDIAIVTNENAGQIIDTTVNIKGKITAVSPADAGDDFTGVSVCGLTLTNNYYTYNYFYTYYGMIKNCKINLDNLELSGEEKANATFAGAVKSNYANLVQTEVTGKATSNTFDLVGLCEENSGAISECTNAAELTQRTASSGWNPIVSGIVLHNYATVQLCINNGSLTSVSTAPKPESDTEENERTCVAVACGIAYYGQAGNNILSSPVIQGCDNNGKVYAKGDNCTVYASGISSSFGNGKIYLCNNNGEILAETSDECKAYSSGIVIFSYWYVQVAQNKNTVTAKGGEAYSAGICAVSYVEADYCINYGEIVANGDNCYLGGIMSLSDVATDLYQGKADHCINKGNLRCTADTKGQVGGIIGKIAEKELEVLTNDDTNITKAGCVQNSFNLGEITCNENCLAGKIIGVCAETAHVEDNLKNNYCLTNDMTVIGQLYKIVEESEEYQNGDNLGARTLSAESIEQLDEYKNILKTVDSYNGNIDNEDVDNEDNKTEENDNEGNGDSEGDSETNEGNGDSEGDSETNEGNGDDDNRGDTGNSGISGGVEL